MFTRKEIEEAGLDDFRVFLRQVWDFLGLPPPTPVQNDIAYALQHGEQRMVVEAFRGVGKSWITVAFVLWCLFIDPQKKIMVVSASQQLADDFSKFCKQLIDGMDILRHLAPREGQRDSAISFDVGPATPSKDPSVKSAGITGQITGSRADIIIGDDIEIPKNSQSHLQRERLSELVKEFDAILKPGPESRILYLGTPQVEATLYNRLGQRGYRITIWPAEVPQRIEAYAGRLAAYVIRKIEQGLAPGTPLDAKRFSREDLDQRRASYGLSGYALQFMLDTNPAEADRHPLKLHDLIIHDVDAEMAHVKLVWGADRDQVIQDLAAGGFDGDFYVRAAFKSPEMAKYTGTVMAIDPSGKGQDETAYAIVKFLHGLLYLVDVGGYTDGFSEATLLALAAKTLRYGVNDIIIEENYGGGMFNALLKPHLIRIGHGRIDDEYNSWSSTQKELRILDTLEPVVQSHRLVVDRRVIEKDIEQQRDIERYSFIQQFSRMARLKGCLPNEDRLEAVSMACGYFTAKMDRDQSRAVEQHKEKLMDEELRKYKDHVFSVSAKPDKHTSGGFLRYQR